MTPEEKEKWEEVLVDPNTFKKQYQEDNIHKNEIQRIEYLEKMIKSYFAKNNESLYLSHINRGYILKLQQFSYMEYLDQLPKKNARFTISNKVIDFIRLLLTDPRTEDLT